MRAIAFYLPQYHPVRENDEWWGKGFTEWRNVAKARPLFPDHYQPHLPADLGFYDLRLAETRAAQAALAQSYHIHGFCYYHYWFNGRRILERPFDEVLASGEPDFPFCLCWANENWTRIWDGGERSVLLKQDYNDDDDRAHIASLLPAFADPRYIRVDGRPLFLVYRTELLPDPRRTAAIWRDAARAAGIGELYLVRVESRVQGLDPVSIGFDAAVEMAPDGERMGQLKYRHGVAGLLSRTGLIPRAFSEHRVLGYRAMVEGMLTRPEVDYKRFHCVMPMWDNSARRALDARIFVGATPGAYERWLRTAAARTRARFDRDEQLVFVNAWNEWAEGCHLEPDLKWGHAFLEATRRALVTPVADSAAAARLPAAGARPRPLRQAWWRLQHHLAACGELAQMVVGRWLR